jgi:hypothetical protein
MTFLFGDITVYNQEVINHERVATLTAACRHALTHRVVAHHVHS